MSKRIQEAIDVIRGISDELMKTNSTDVRRARIKATEIAAAIHSVDSRTIHDKITRQFEKTAEEFDAMLKSDLFENNDALCKFLLDKAIDDEDKCLINGFFIDINGKLDLYLMDRYGHDVNDKTYCEGKWKYYLHEKMERNQTLVKDAKKKWTELSNGNIKCVVCGFSFRDKYGSIGERFIEAHHSTVYVSEIVNETELTIDDLVPVCSNCHSMLHITRPWKRVDELSNIIENNKLNDFA